MARSTAATGSTSVSVNQPVKSLVSLYLLVDEDFKYPIAKIKSGADGSYDVAPSDVREFLINLPSDNFSARLWISAARCHRWDRQQLHGCRDHLSL